MNISANQEQIYAYIGQRIRERRKLLKLNQTDLAELMGFSYQQMQKYESGASHVSAGKLLMFAKIMNVPPTYFYDGIKMEETIGKRILSHTIQKNRTDAFRILLVEDNPADVILFRKALAARAGAFDVQSLHDAESVMDFLQNHAARVGGELPDLVLLDLSLPKHSGLDVLKAIKKHPKMGEMPVVILTNSINRKDLTDAYRLGAAGFIQKSVELEEYMETIDTVVKYWSKVVALPCG
ncbi:MAG: response regulator [Alphaproteobacteria bacterium]|nr:response regulator [Alphaproteobacteria bacterium]